MNTIVNLIPMMLGTALAPLWPILVLFILKSRNGLLKAIAFVLGITLTRVLQWLAFSYVLHDTGNGDGSSPIVSVLLMVLGILLLASALKTLIKGSDPDAPPPKWMSLFDRASALQLLGLGALFTLAAPKLWIFTLSAISVIRDADLAPGQSVQMYALYVLGAQTLLILPLLAYAIAPRQSADRLQSASDWLMKHSSQITLVVSLVFGVLFFWKGLSSLL